MDHQEKFDSIQSKMDKIIETLKPEVSSEIVEKIRLCDEKIEKQLKKFDPILSKLNEIDKTLKPEVTLKFEKLSKEHQEKFDSIQSKLNKVVEKLKPETISGIEQKIRLSDEKTEKLLNELQSKMDKIIEAMKPEKSSEVVEKIRLSDERIEKLSKKFDSVQWKLNQTNNTLKPEISSEIKKLSKEHQEKFDSIQSKRDKVVETLKPEVSSKSVENIDSATSGKYFVLKHTFKNVSSFEEDKDYHSEDEEHFGVQWQINVKRCGRFLELYLWNSFFQNTEKKREIKVEYELKIVTHSSREKKEKSKGKSGRVFNSDGTFNGWGYNKFIEWDKLEHDFLVDDCFSAEITVKVKNMTGIYKENLRSFDNSMEECTDVVLIVNNEKFNVLKSYLAMHSPYFKILFLGKFNEAKKTEIKLSGIDSDDFQKYLEVLYGEQAIDEFTVEGILLVAVKYATPVVIEKCENFLQNVSRKTLKKKLQLSKRYNLAKLMKQCIE